MPQTLRENGDPLNAVNQNGYSSISRYESIWQSVIGNDGNNQPLPIPGLLTG